MDSSKSQIVQGWLALQGRLENQLNTIAKEESNALGMARRSLQTSLDHLGQLQETIAAYRFEQGEEIQFYKEIRPYFLSFVKFYSRLFKIEAGRPPADPAGLETYYTAELSKLFTVYDEHRFIHQYMESGATHLDDKLFFHPGSDSLFTMTGMEPPVDGAFAVCYDHVVAQLLSADLLKKYLLDVLDDLSIPGNSAGNLPKITWTAPKAHVIELAYALFASGVFNNGKAPLKDIVECLEIAFHVKAGNYPRTMQEILYRKSGYTVFIDDMKNRYLLYIQRIEDKHIG